MSKKVGIITHWYSSYNYGGHLQAYALCRTLNSMGADAKQIQYVWCHDVNLTIEKRATIKKIGCVDILRKFKNAIYYAKAKEFPSVYEARKRAFSHFRNELIAHTDRVYDKTNIKDAYSCFDVLVTGSDQVWNLQWYEPEFFLDSVPENKTKVAYAASISMNGFNEAQEEIFTEKLKSFNAISVREKDFCILLKDITTQEIFHCIDPVFLLDSTQWEEIAAEKVLDKKYIFCYLLGTSKENRKIIKKYAKQNKLKIVSFPYLGGYSNADAFFGDIRINNASPEQFLSLIKNAECVFTDSFHATAFSLIFKKQFFVLDRDGHSGMGMRIKDLCRLFDIESRYINSSEKKNTRYLNYLEPYDFDKERPVYIRTLKESLDFIKRFILKEN